MSDPRLFAWMNALIGYVRSGHPDLTNRQMAVLTICYLTRGPHKVRGMTRQLGISKPVITRALNTLCALGYLRRVRDENDGRNIFAARTDKGAAFLNAFSKPMDD